MIKLYDVKHERFCDGEFIIDVFADNELFSAYITHQDYGVSSLIFAMPVLQQTYEEFLEMVEYSIPEQVMIYEDLYMN